VRALLICSQVVQGVGAQRLQASITALVHPDAQAYRGVALSLRGERSTHTRDSWERLEHASHPPAKGHQTGRELVIEYVATTLVIRHAMGEVVQCVCVDAAT